MEELEKNETNAEVGGQRDENATSWTAADEAKASAQEKMLRDGLEDYELQPEDLALLSGETDLSFGAPDTSSWPTVAIVGRPNVGKSTLVNRILGRREAVVLDEPGVTRDRVTYDVQWNGRDFHLVDTGGWDVGVKGLDKAVAQQAEIAISLADVALFVVDANVGATASDEEMMRLLRSSKKPVILAANKVDSERAEADAAALWNLGLGEPYPISALHGRGVGDLLDVLVQALPEVGENRVERPSDSTPRVALVGRPNVGKSSLLNSLAGSGRAVVSEVPGTTRDPVDEVLELEGKEWVFVDTAGIRRRIKQTVGADYYSVLRTQAAIENAEVALVLLDGGEPLTEQDVKVVNQVVEAGRALVIVNNKWDLVDEYRQQVLKREQVADLAHVDWAPKINIAAKTGWHTNRIVRALEAALEGWTTRIPTSRLNAFLGELVAAHPHPLRGGKQPRILYATQAGVCPPRFVLFTTGFLDPQYRRFVERRLRETFGFVGSPVRIGVRVREKRRR
ncbi:MAG: ribosome biogenesis GTPase Der [Mobiluncus porci]|uniref:ribosome biogenesis GTPase Der n=1 Tax=Mobiluncus porci TaxID=2652278 RepID=UPI0023F399D3|nr:ribosome biogenesis GTPase Der [Mobiluncus porci]MDD7541575.1 ribosome biogenesis GTPase Der [Mobiluncus porci]MDY5748560.1 ribosome biogenesis GTPase Der [Mobiluncus porci]